MVAVGRVAIGLFDEHRHQALADLVEVLRDRGEAT